DESPIPPKTGTSWPESSAPSRQRSVDHKIRRLTDRPDRNRQEPEVPVHDSVLERSGRLVTGRAGAPRQVRAPMVEPFGPTERSEVEPHRLVDRRIVPAARAELRKSVERPPISC